MKADAELKGVKTAITNIFYIFKKVEENKHNGERSGRYKKPQM